MIPRRPAAAILLAAVLAVPQIALAHVGSPDIFLDSQAGPYRILVTVRPPYAVPGIADVEIQAMTGGVTDVKIVPLPLTGPGAQFAPVPDVAKVAPDNARLFTGHLWMMSAGAWQVRVTVSGDRGEGTLSVPVPTLPQTTLAMAPALRVLLLVLMIVLCAGFIGIASAIFRETQLGPGEAPNRAARRGGRIAGLVAAGICAVAVMSGNRWWTAEASSYSRYVYKPLEATPTVTADARLQLQLQDPGWIASRRLDDFVPDHDHLMHLFVVTPALDRLWHLHPDETAPGTFERRLPDMPNGEHELFGDLVHATGVSETVTGRFTTDGIHGAPLTGDDSAWADVRQSPDATSADDTRIVWLRDEKIPLAPKRLTLFTFRVEDANRQPAEDLELYMGMPGHAIFVKRDRRVFAHVHPSGSAPMAALTIAMPASAPDPHVMHMQPAGNALPPTVSFPYGFPETGDYRIFMQVKRRGRIVTAAFDAHVE